MKPGQNIWLGKSSTNLHWLKNTSEQHRTGQLSCVPEKCHRDKWQLLPTLPQTEVAPNISLLLPEGRKWLKPVSQNRLMLVKALLAASAGSHSSASPRSWHCWGQHSWHRTLSSQTPLPMARTARALGPFHRKPWDSTMMFGSTNPSL